LPIEQTQQQILHNGKWNNVIHPKAASVTINKVDLTETQLNGSASDENRTEMGVLCIRASKGETAG
jgi:hypothetical protein